MVEGRRIKKNMSATESANYIYNLSGGMFLPRVIESALPGLSLENARVNRWISLVCVGCSAHTS